MSDHNFRSESRQSVRPTWMPRVLLILAIAVIALAAFREASTRRGNDFEPSNTQGSLEDLTWRDAQKVNSIYAFRNFVRRFPTSKHVREANRKIEVLTWHEACDGNSTEDLEQYLKLYPKGTYASEAQQKIEELIWHQALAQNSCVPLRRYAKLYPDGKYSLQANQKIEHLTWQSAIQSNSIKSLQLYLAVYPKGKFVGAARLAIKQLLVDDAPYFLATQRGNQNALLHFLADFPGHRKAKEAKTALKDLAGRDFFELLKEKKIEAKAHGVGIQSMQLQIRRLVPHAVTVEVPVATRFVSHNASTQNMISITYGTRSPDGHQLISARWTIKSRDWKTFSVSCVCMDRSKRIPGYRNKLLSELSGKPIPDHFDIQRPQTIPVDFGAIMNTVDRWRATLKPGKPPYWISRYNDIMQAIAWIVYGDANYQELGTLQINSRRVIDANAAAQAMRLCAIAGVDVTKKRIWKDRARLVEAIQDPNLKKWLILPH